MAALDLSVIIVNWNTRAELQRCLASVHHCAADLAVEVIVVDNNSNDGSVEWLQSVDSGVQLIVNKRNLGFARAFNQGLRAARGGALLALNPDCELRPGSIQALLARLTELPEAGVVTPTLVDDSGRRRHSFANFPTLLTEGFNKSILQMLAPRRYPSKRRDYAAPIQVESAVGACMLVRREAAESVGPMDEGYFLYLEETDWCYRMARAGWRCYYVPEAVVLHRVGSAARRAPIASRLEYYRARYRFFETQRSPRSRRALAVIQSLRLCSSVVANGLATAVTLGMLEDRRQRLRRSGALLAWHLRGCPPGWGIEPAAASSVRPLRGEERLLVVKLGALGDVVHTLPVVAALKRTYSGLHIAWLVESAHQAVLRDQPFVDEVIAVETRKWRRQPFSRATRRAVGALRAQLAALRPDVAIDFQGLYKSALLTIISRAPRRIGLGLLREWVPWAYTERVPMPTWDESAVDRYQRVAAYLGGAPEEIRFPLPRDAEADRSVARRLQDIQRPQAGDSGALIVVHAGAGKPANSWFPERFAHVADALSRHERARIVFTGGPADQQLVSKIRGMMKQPSLDWCRKTSLPELIALMRRADLCIAGDTGPAHLAAAVDCPIVSIFGPANPQRTAPYRGATVLHDPPPCGPCYRRTYCSHMTCFQRLTVDRVLAACRERLAGVARETYAHL